MTTGDARGLEGRVAVRPLLAIVLSAVFVSVMTQSLINVVVPVIGEDFGASEGQVGWVITGYLLVFAVGIPLYGRISDLYSLRRTFSLGLLGLAAGSVVCALAPNLPVLVAGRILQAAGSSAIPALGFAAIAGVLPPGRRGSALGLLSSSVGIGAAVGPIVGGLVAGFADWRILFYGTLFLALLLTIAAWRVLPDMALGGDATKTRSFDLPGGLFLALASGLALFGVTQGQAAGFSSVSSWGSFLLAAFSAVLFAWRIRRADEPFVSPSLFQNRAFLAGASVGFFAMFANLAGLVLAPFLLSGVNGLSSIGIGIALVPGAIALALLSPLAGQLSDRIGARAPIYAGLLVMLLSVLFLSSFGAGASAILVAVGMLGLGTGFAAINSPTANATAATLSGGETGVGLGIYQMLFFLGGGFGPAIAGAFLAARRESGAGALNPLYSLEASSYSDAFLVIVVALLIAFAASFGLKARVKE
jgi:DHA2 family metal-tetracycline-proton antiporter-like MFS transporter